MPSRVPNLEITNGTRNGTLFGWENLIEFDMLFCRKPPKKALNVEKPYFSVRLSPF